MVDRALMVGPRRENRLRLTVIAACLGLGLSLSGVARMAEADLGVPTVPPAPPPVNDAAAKHAKRTACLKDAQIKKLVGAVRDQYVKNCVAMK
jgi:hypothetical protein